MSTMNLKILSHELVIFRFDPDEEIPEVVYESPFFSITKTHEELSIICVESIMSSLFEGSAGWRCLMVEGPLDFSITGVLSALSAPLSAAGIPIVAVSTFDTDYLLIKVDDLAQTVQVLKKLGHKVESEIQIPKLCGGCRR